MSITISGDGDINATGNDIELNSTGTTDVTLAVGGGSVGVGVASPTATLDVNGTIKLDGNYPVGTGNVALGDTALDSNVSGGSNTAIGADALTANTANNNTAVGYHAGYTNASGINHTLIGKDAGYSTTGSSNTFVGVDSGYYVSSGGSNTVLGRYNGNQGGLDIRTSSNNIVLSDGAGNPRTHINSTGHHFISPDLSTMGNSGNKHVTANTVTGNYIQVFEHSAASSNVYGLFVNFYAASPNDNVRSFIACQDSTTPRFIVRSNGNVVNTNNTYGAISDEKLKENIVDSGSQWDDIKALRVRKYSMKEDALDAPNRLGVIAQEVEAAGMGGLVIESPDKDKDLNDLGTTTKSVNYSVLYMKAVKALQEAMERIETLEAKVQALETP